MAGLIPPREIRHAIMPTGFDIGDMVTIHLPNGNSLTAAIVHDWTPEGITFTRKGLVQFMPWSNVWMIAQPEREG